MLKSFALLIGLVGMISPQAVPCSWAAEPTTSNASDEGVKCTNLEAADFSLVPDAPTHISEAKLVDATGGVPAHCQVRGYVMPQVGFEILLPAARWNNKFIEVGCSGLCGTVDKYACDGALRRRYACIASDMGHDEGGDGHDGLWGYNNLQAKVDFGYRAAHVVAVAGKMITRRYYNQVPQKAYFAGCSTGGREGMVEAQRFPEDFDGIIAGAPPINFSANSMAQMWASLAAKNKDGSAILGPTIVQLVHKAVLDKCDLDDGIRDGIVGDPRECGFDPATLACSGDRKASCLTDEQVAAIRKIYSGPFASTKIISAGGFMPGSELAWIGIYFSPDGGPGLIYSYGAEKFRYLTFFPDPGPGWKPTDLNWNSDYQRFGAMESLYSAADPDLRQFKRDGGKLLVYEGWNDPAEPPASVTDYYETAERLMGGRASTQEFFRLFMVPGMDHCVGGDGAWAIDYLTYLEDWVEHAKAPDRLIGAHIRLPDDSARSQEVIRDLTFPLDASDIVFTRPVFPYPLRAKYRGAGSPTDAANFVPTGEEGISGPAGALRGGAAAKTTK